jgi:hypothetical protein
VKPKDQHVARRRLQTVARETRRVLSTLNGGSLASWRLLSTLADAGLAGEALEALKAQLALIESSAIRAQAETGTHTAVAESNAAGELEIVGAGYKAGHAGRPAENARAVLASMTGVALEKHGVRISKTRGGAFERVLRVLFRDAGLFEPHDLHRTVIRTVEHARRIKAHSSLFRPSR